MNQVQQSTHAGMLCPACKVDLVMTERQNIEIDYCPKCRGVWLDRGELDKIIEKSVREQEPAAAAAPPPVEPQRPPERDYDRDRGYDRDRDRGYDRDRRYDRDDRYYGKHRRKSWLEEIFD